MHLGLFAIGGGNHIAGWRHPGAYARGDDFNAFAHMAQSAERACFDMFFIADALACSTDGHPGFMAQLDPIATLTGLAAVTSNIGLVGTASTTFNDPYMLSRQLASLDHISHGRAGWNIVTSSDPRAELNFGAKSVAHDERYAIAAEFVEVALGLWDSWEEDAIVADAVTGRYVNPDRVHPLNHQGEHYHVAGPLNTPRCPQGRPVLVQAGSSTAGQAFASRYAEVLFTVQQDLDVARDFYAAVKRQVADRGRNPAHCKIMPGLTTVVGGTEAEAKAKLEQLADYVDERSAMQTMSVRLGHDMSKYPLDGPVPDLPVSDQIQGYARMMLTSAYREKSKLRDLYNLFAVSRGYLIFCGTPEQIADSMTTWVESPACDGFNLTPAHFPEALDDLVDGVVPVLQNRGVFRRDYDSDTLRGHFGLPEPENRHTRARRSS